MNFYKLLQMSTKVLKEKISSSNKDEKKLYLKALITKDILCVLFAIIFIVCLNIVFGDKNSSFAVVIFCILLGIRFVDFDYKLSTSIFNLLICFILIILGSYLNIFLNPLLSFIINFIFIMTILIMTCENPLYGNSSLYVFGYILLFGSPVTGYDMYLRVCEMLFGFIICALVLYKKNKNKKYTKSFKDVLKNFSLKDKKCTWQLHLALSVSLGMLIGSILHIQRVMWMGIVIMSVLNSYQESPYTRIKDRIISTIMGSILFLIIYSLIPNQYISLIGPLSGLLFGLSASYKWGNFFNCFGAILLASTIYGEYMAAYLRIQNTILGCLFALVFYYLFNKLTYKKIQN